MTIARLLPGIGLCLVALGLLTFGASADELPDGTYNCIMGFQVMLTIGRATIDGNSYSFAPEDGSSPTEGTYQIQPDSSIVWQGDFGALRNEQIVSSGREYGRSDAFWLKTKLTPESSTETTSCRLLQ